MPKLTAKQQAFVDHFNGNATEAAIKAGYSEKNARNTGCRMLTNANVLAAIKKRQEKPRALRIATREERQAFWTRVLMGQELETKYDSEGNEYKKTPEMRDRLKASELLAKSDCDFINKVELSGGVTVKGTKKRYDGGN